MLGLPLPPWLNPTLIGAGLIAVGAFGGGMWLEHKLDAPALAQAQKATLQAQNEFAAYQTKIAGDAAVANAKTLSDRLALEAKNTKIEADLAKAQNAAKLASDKLKDILNHAAPQDTRNLGPTTLAYISGVRAAQAATAPNH